uniref:Phosphatidate cytidylyltransferase, mitochondrial n=1 Tax=Fagus sylvatica TaxID=28930 RepID=A0A2N9H2S4_FAGSY
MVVASREARDKASEADETHPAQGPQIGVAGGEREEREREENVKERGRGVIMENRDKAELEGFLKVLPPVDFCCVYGSALHPNNREKSTMVDYILGVSDPEQWHSQNLKMNKNHYASWMVHLGGAKLITQIADEIGVGVHFNPFVTWNDKMFKYGVVRMHDLVQDILNWERFYLSGRLQKPSMLNPALPRLGFSVTSNRSTSTDRELLFATAAERPYALVNILVDNLDIENVNSSNLRAAMSAALLLLPPKFSEEDLYAKICSLSYMGDLRMLFAEDRNKVKKIVQGQFGLFHSKYKPFLEEYEAKEFLRLGSSGSHQKNISQDCGSSVACSLVNSLPPMVRNQMGMKLGEKKKLTESGRIIREVLIGSREEAAKCMQKVLRRTVMVSSTRQAVSGLLAVGGVNAVREVFTRINKEDILIGELHDFDLH